MLLQVYGKHMLLPACVHSANLLQLSFYSSASTANQLFAADHN